MAAVSVEPDLRPLREDYSVRNSLGQLASGGGRKNVDKSPIDGAMVRFSRGLQPNSEYEQSIAFFDDAMVRVTAPLEIDCGKTAAVSVRSKLAGDLGQVYFSEDGDIKSARKYLRWDTSLDFINLFPQYVTRLVGIRVGSL